MKHKVQQITIGAFAKAAGVSAPTIRYYEEIGLLPLDARQADNGAMIRPTLGG